MKGTAQKLILISFALALVGALIFFIYVKSLKETNKSVKKIKVLVAAENIPSMTLIEKKMVKEIEVADNSIVKNYISDSSKIIGKYAKETVYKDEGFISNILLDKNSDELSLRIDSGSRAVSLNVTGDSAVSDLLKPEDYVDVVVYTAEKKDGTSVIRNDEAKIILQNIKVLAVDKDINRSGSSNESTSQAGKTLSNFLVTLSVPSNDVEKLVLAQSIGSIKLVLRPMNDKNTVNTDGTTWKELSVKDSTVEDQKNEDQKKTEKSEVSEEKEYDAYTVKRGDTLRKISLKFYGTKSKSTLIEKANNINNKNLIKPGQILKIPVLK